MAFHIRAFRASLVVSASLSLLSSPLPMIPNNPHRAFNLNRGIILRPLFPDQFVLICLPLVPPNTVFDIASVVPSPVSLLMSYPQIRKQIAMVRFREERRQLGKFKGPSQGNSRNKMK
ncbi:hypothetical protein BDP55DRAFT_637827 [Colletotrichum godetiae]|uniref:Uncharacterized protein n=1 Tax=Colletotrichum godetiae TaxID=1209918 RepID=A0AAJ0A8J7_9PEZI|nr:uncharacterized protein BDP55DRAFT_637827 [Colletotrichum godetiae]KAK1658467.1 hypothetical protein BDP55DRAFT_637827 [Colletotrichum godetiae]